MLAGSTIATTACRCHRHSSTHVSLSIIWSSNDNPIMEATTCRSCYGASCKQRFLLFRLVTKATIRLLLLSSSFGVLVLCSGNCCGAFGLQPSLQQHALSAQRERMGGRRLRGDHEPSSLTNNNDNQRIKGGGWMDIPSRRA